MLRIKDQKVVTFNTPQTKSSIPTLATPTKSDMSLDSLVNWIQIHRESLNQALIEAGALLFRGFGVNSPEDFQSVCQAFSLDLLHYVGGSTPRSIIQGKVYTSTQYPAQQHIMLHNECSYLKKMPSTIFFFCQHPPHVSRRNSHWRYAPSIRKNCPGDSGKIRGERGLLYQ